MLLSPSPTSLGVLPTRQDVQQGCLAASRWAKHSHKLTRRNKACNLLQDAVVACESNQSESMQHIATCCNFNLQATAYCKAQALPLQGQVQARSSIVTIQSPRRLSHFVHWCSRGAGTCSAWSCIGTCILHLSASASDSLSRSFLFPPPTVAALLFASPLYRLPVTSFSGRLSRSLAASSMAPGARMRRPRNRRKEKLKKLKMLRLTVSAAEAWPGNFHTRDAQNTNHDWLPSLTAVAAHFLPQQLKDHNSVAHV